MFRTFTVGIALTLFALIATAQESAQKAKIKKVDAAKGLLTVSTPAGKDLELTAIPSTLFIGVDGKPIQDGLKDKSFKEGVLVMFKVKSQDNKLLLIGVKLAVSVEAIPQVDTSKFKPLTEMEAEEYHGFKGGLYPDGKNVRPAAHEKAGLALASKVEPLDAEGKPSPRGKIVLLSVGMSNTTQVFSAFKRIADKDSATNPALVIVDGAQGGATAARIQDPENANGGVQFWSTVDKRLQMEGVSRAQVQAVWIKEADAGPTQGFPKYARTLQEELTRVVQLLPRRFPSVKLVYLSSRTYAGYAKTKLNPEPYAFESGYSVKWLIEDQLQGNPALNYDPAKGPVTAPWLSWGPYLWANGTAKRLDGFYYEPSDFGDDGTHPAPAGQQKVARLLLEFFKNDSTTKGWFERK